MVNVNGERVHFISDSGGYFHNAALMVVLCKLNNLLPGQDVSVFSFLSYRDCAENDHVPAGKSQLRHRQ